jgi:hypothetical protein
MYIKGALDSAQNHRMRRVTIYHLDAQESGKTWQISGINFQSYISIVN